MAQFLLGFQTTDDTTLSAFPSIAVNQKTALYDIPLGWCYGNQTLSYGLYIASLVLNDQSINESAKSIAHRTLRRDTFEKAYSKNTDAGFCHGASSLAYLQKKWGQLPMILNLKGYIKSSFKFLCLKETTIKGWQGYRKYLGNNKYESAIGLLDGIVGIGIVFIDAIIEDEKNINWPSFFLLDYNSSKD